MGLWGSGFLQTRQRLWLCVGTGPASWDSHAPTAVLASSRPAWRAELLPLEGRAGDRAAGRPFGALPASHRAQGGVSHVPLVSVSSSVTLSSGSPVLPVKLLSHSIYLV